MGISSSLAHTATTQHKIQARVWDEYPQKLFGEIEAIYVRRMRLAAE
jgi:hypothetical protein